MCSRLPVEHVCHNGSCCLLTSPPASIDCPLCLHSSVHYTEDRRRRYFQCPVCELVFADPESHLSPVDEKRVYDQHENDPADPRYRGFLNRLAAPLIERLDPGMHGLDYGSGPGPTLSVMLTEAGFPTEDYDPYFAPDPARLERQYDFVTCTETAEHFHHPARDWKRLARLVRSGGWLGVMTKLVISRERFEQWHYKNDPTHVSFYHPRTFQWLGETFKFDVQRVATDVILMHKHE